jgi:hypothetical protein
MQPLQYQLPTVPLLGKGMILLDRYDAAGLPTGALAMGNATKFGFDTKDDIAEQYSSMNASSNLLHTALKKRQVKISITGTEFSPDVLAIPMMSAGKSALAVAAGTVTAEVLVSATARHANRYFRTTSRNIDNVTIAPVLTNNSNVLAAGTDYIVVDPVQGLIYFPPGTTAVDTHPTTITYHTLVGTFSQIAGAVSPVVTAKLIFSPDPTDGQKIGVEVWKVNFSPTGTMEFIADDYGNWQLDGLVLDDTANHPTAPFYDLTYYP